jgi:hypothetical protein
VKYSNNLAEITRIANQIFDEISNPCRLQKRPGVLSSGCKNGGDCTVIRCPRIEIIINLEANELNECLYCGEAIPYSEEFCNDECSENYCNEI